MSFSCQLCDHDFLVKALQRGADKTFHNEGDGALNAIPRSIVILTLLWPRYIHIYDHIYYYRPVITLQL